MNPYLIVRFFVENKMQTKEALYTTAICLQSGLSPFTKMYDGKTLFEISCEIKAEYYVRMFLIFWDANPSWELHDEVYKLQHGKNMQMLNSIQEYALHSKQSLIKNHLLNVLHLSFI